MTFSEDLQTRKNDARQEYKKACADWMETRTADNINGNFEKWKIVCDKKRDCMRLSDAHGNAAGTFQLLPDATGFLLKKLRRTTTGLLVIK